MDINIQTQVTQSITNGVTLYAPSSDAVFDALALKQATLVSATNIKTINGSPILGSGNLVVGGALIVGTTTITGATNTNILYNNNGVAGEYTLTGTGAVVAMQTSPTFVTDATVPLVYGSTALGGSLTLRSTSHATKGLIYFGSAGTTVYDEVNDRFGMGITSPSSRFHIYHATGGVSKGLRIETGGTGNTGYASIDFSTPTNAAHLQIACYGSTATNANYSLWYNNNAGTIWYATGTAFMKQSSAGKLYIGGSSDASAWLHVNGATEQLRLGYDSSNYCTTTVSSAGAVTFDAVGSSSSFKFSDSVVTASGALSTSATTGHLYIPTCAGTPTGVPTTQTGTVGMVYDTTNNKLYIYNGAWKGGTAPGTFS